MTTDDVDNFNTQVDTPLLSPLNKHSGLRTTSRHLSPKRYVDPRHVMLLYNAHPLFTYLCYKAHVKGGENIAIY